MLTSPPSYPRILRRIQAACIDGVIIPVAAVGSIVALTYAGVQSGYVKGAVAVLLILALEPLAVSVSGGSVGHHIVGIRVRRLSRDARLNPLMALIRFVAKTLLGIPAFFVALITKRRQGLHDVFARSVVVYKDSTSLPAHESMPELTRDEEHRAYVSVTRRLATIGLYWLLSVFALFTFLPLSVSRHCAQGGTCDKGEDLLILTELGLFVVALALFAVLGWLGRLYGCRKHRAAVA